MRTHGLSKTRAYNAWQHMMRRCFNPNDQGFARYGGRGIIVCKRWQKFENFFADMGDCTKGLSLERKDNNLGYSPDNCCWIPCAKQAQNRNCNRYVELDGERVPINEAAKRLGMKKTTLAWRIEHGFKRDVITGWVGKGVRLTLNGETHNIREWARKLKISEATLTSRRRSGWPVERILGGTASL